MMRESCNFQSFKWKEELSPEFYSVLSPFRGDNQMIQSSDPLYCDSLPSCTPMDLLTCKCEMTEYLNYS